MSLLDSIHELWHLVGEVWDAGDIAGNAGVLRDKARQWRAMEAEVRSLVADLDASVNQHLTSGRGGNWNDHAGDAFQNVWGQTQRQAHDMANELGQVAANLEQFAAEVDHFNSSFHTCLVVIAASLAVMAATTWIPVVDVVTDGASLAADAAEVDEAWSLIATLRGVLVFLRGSLVRNFVFTLAKNFLINFPVYFSSRMLERWLVLGDPTEGWSQYDSNQLLLLSGMASVTATLIPMTSLGRWAALPTTRAGSFAELPWGQFLRASGLRMGQALVVTNVFNVVNHMALKGEGVHFDWASVLGLGSLAQGVPTLVVIGGNALWFIASGGTGGVPHTLTMPAVVGANTVFDVGIPGLSPQVRQARGLIYVTAGGHLPAVPVSPAQQATGIIPVLPTRIVKPGDTLWDIAVQQYGRDAGLRYHDIVRRNHIADPNLIRPGQLLVLPPVAPAA